jgi:signal transduction histidine kinase
MNPVKITSVLMLEPAGALPPALTEAAGEAFPGVACTAVADLAEAMGRPLCSGLELLCLAAEPKAGEVPPDELLDADSLPRWGVVRFAGAAPDVVKSVWSKEALIPLLREAAARHALSRDNARLRGELLTMARRVSHDLRTPLGGIIATVDMLAETIPAVGQSASPVFAAIDEITKIITRTSSLLKAIAQPLPRTLVNMGTAVEEALRRLERPLYEKQATLHQPDAWPEVAGVAPWLELIWWNLIHNALQHSATPQVITMGWEKETEGHRFWIRDSGPGLPGSSGRPVFPSFHLLHGPNAGHGLGLPIVRRLTELQGGTCGYHQAAGESPAFSFFLPDEA